MFTKRLEPTEEEIIMDSLLGTLDWNSIFMNCNLSSYFLNKYRLQFDYEINRRLRRTSPHFSKIIDIYIDYCLSEIQNKKITTIIDNFGENVKYRTLDEYFTHGVCYVLEGCLLSPDSIIDTDSRLEMIIEDSLRNYIKGGNIEFFPQKFLWEVKFYIKDTDIEILNFLEKSYNNVKVFCSKLNNLL